MIVRIMKSVCGVVLLVLMLASCSGSGESGSSPVSGVASAGSPLIGTVYLKDSSFPAKELSAPIAVDGSFSFDSKGLTPPYILKAVGTVHGKTQCLYSFATTTAITNINPLSNLAVALANGSDHMTSLYETIDSTAMYRILHALPNATKDVKKVLEPTLAQFGAATVDFMSETYTANHKGLDLFLDMISISVFGHGYVYVSETDNPANTACIPFNGFADNAPISINVSPAPDGSVHVAPLKAVVAPNETLNLTGFVIGRSEPQIVWHVLEENGGIITNAGVYTAPGTTGTYHITATNPVDPSKSTTVTIVVGFKNLLRVVRSAPGMYTVKAENFTGVFGVSFSLTYDTTRLANPRVTPGQLPADAIYLGNTGTPGSVHWALISAKEPLADSCNLATITFDLLTGSPGGLLSITADLGDYNGWTLASTAVFEPGS